jgi:hypothetical protein
MSFLERWSSARCACFARLLLGGVESGESSVSGDTVKPTLEQAGQRFEHYELVTGEDGKPVELGRGAMGITYKAFDINLRSPVTLKVISERYLGDESGGVGERLHLRIDSVYAPEPISTPKARRATEADSECSSCRVLSRRPLS